MADKIQKITSQQIFAEMKAKNPLLSDEEIISIINNMSAEIKLTDTQQISILTNESNKQVDLESKSEKRLEEIRKRLQKVSVDFVAAEKNNGAIGWLWNNIKNTFNIGDSSNDVKGLLKSELKILESGDLKTVFFEITGLDYNEENYNKFLKGEVKTKSEEALSEYEIGQEDSSDFAGDLASGVLSASLYTFAACNINNIG